ncbi:MAG: hypothetical protein JNN05_11765, partial [Candidatus Omnitrophica bacterium]|nr:hypothetical protein [Candidatus Omnitrophota bacterium]
MKPIALCALFVFAGSINIFAQTTSISTLAVKNLKTITAKESTSNTATDKDPKPQTKEITPASLQDPTNVKASTDPAIVASATQDPKVPSPTSQDKSTAATPTTAVSDKTKDAKTDKKATTTTQKTMVSALAATATTSSGALTNAFSTLNTLSVAVQPFTGGASLPINISVPAGRGGIQPSVALVYSSELPESFAGVGWNLDLGSIQRSTKKGPPKYNSSDTFVLMQNGSSSNLVWDGTALMYRQEIEDDFSKITSTGSGATLKWIVTDKKGTKYYFGQSAASQEVDPADAAKIFSWALDRVEDINGNYMTITYIKASNMLYPDTIQYTGNSQTPVIAPFAKVVFNYTDVARTLISYRRSFLVNSTKLLD